MSYLQKVILLISTRLRQVAKLMTTLEVRSVQCIPLSITLSNRISSSLFSVNSNSLLRLVSLLSLSLVFSCDLIFTCPLFVCSNIWKRINICRILIFGIPSHPRSLIVTPEMMIRRSPAACSTEMTSRVCRPMIDYSSFFSMTLPYSVPKWSKYKKN